jgi:chromosome segregation ATPase
MSVSIEKKSLEAHVELCAERYGRLEEKLDHLEKRLHTIEQSITDIKDSLVKTTNKGYEKIIQVGWVMLSGIVGFVAMYLIKMVNP